MVKGLKISTLCFFILLLSVILSKVSFTKTLKLITVVKSREISSYGTALKGFEDKLKEGGLKFLTYEYNLQENLKVEEIIKGIKLRKSDLILTFGSSATQIVKVVKDIPVVFSMVLDPVGSGFVKDIGSQGNNFTGVSMQIPVDEQFRQLKSVVPAAKKVGVLYNQKESEKIVGKALRVSKEMGLELITGLVRSQKDVPGVLEDIGAEIDALWAVPDPVVFTPQSTRFILLFTLRQKLPFMGLSPSFVKAGALFAVYNDFYEIGRQTGEIAQEILKGKEPSSIPVAFPKKIRLTINCRVAEIIELKIPRKVLDRTDKIFK